MRRKAHSANLIWLSSPKEKRGKRQPWGAADASSGRGNVRVNFSANLLNVIAAPVPQSESTPNLARFYDGNPIRRQSWFPAAPLAYTTAFCKRSRANNLWSSLFFFNLRHRPFYFANNAQRRAIYAHKRHEEETLMRLMNMWERTCYTPMNDDFIIPVVHTYDRHAFNIIAMHAAHARVLIFPSRGKCWLFGTCMREGCKAAREIPDLCALH